MVELWIRTKHKAAWNKIKKMGNCSVNTWDHQGRSTVVHNCCGWLQFKSSARNLGSQDCHKSNNTSHIMNIRFQIKEWEGNVHPRTGHENPAGEQRYSSTLSLTSVLDTGGWSTPHPSRFTPRKRPGTHCTGGWVGPRAGPDRRGISRLYWDSTSRLSSPEWVTILTTLSQPTMKGMRKQNFCNLHIRWQVPLPCPGDRLEYPIVYPYVATLIWLEECLMDVHTTFKQYG
jgi:hypothetical protein